MRVQLRHSFLYNFFSTETQHIHSLKFLVDSSDGVIIVMAIHIPAKLKAADLTRFIVRAAQLEVVKPVVAYWCEYWIVNQILSKELHNDDPETLQYTTALMDKLEQIKADNTMNDAIVDDVAGRAYVEQFALETFQRADKTVQANKVTKQTVDTFQAAATFLELVNIWSPPDAETQAKIKYAKWNAVRIVKALKEGKDPNESNPKTEKAEENLPELDPNDPEVKQLGQPTKSRQASVEEVPDGQDILEAHLAKQSSLGHSLHPSAQVSVRGSPGPEAESFDPYARKEFAYTAPQGDNVSPLEQSPGGRNGSIGGGYFPEVPTFTSESRDSTTSTAPPGDSIDLGLPDTSDLYAPSSAPPPDLATYSPAVSKHSPSPQDFYNQAPPPSFPHPPQHPQYTPATPKQPQHTPVPQQPPYYPTPAPISASATISKGQLTTDDVAIAKAQKHARWAISALNFEDAETAVKELRAALQTLGAQ
ncbi:hypothetical protein B7494_g4785 [Chlorociboria aeruginascens]|nr:hypothetical protein B7494_g4785 [Chlorociboria aeruginascens]